jgi:tetratricopeptide (TPR) repeat protein
MPICHAILRGITVFFWLGLFVYVGHIESRFCNPLPCTFYLTKHHYYEIGVIYLRLERLDEALTYFSQVYICIYEFVYICMYVCMYKCKYINVCMYMYICIFIYRLERLDEALTYFSQVHINIYIYKYVYIYIYIYIHT